MSRRSRGLQDAAVAGAAEGIVLEHHGDAFHTAVGDQSGNDLLGLLVVGGTQVDDVAPLRVAQERRAGERGDVGGARGGGDRCGGARCRRPDGADEGEDTLLGDELLRIGDGGLRLVGVVEGHQFQAPAGNTAVAVGLGEGRLDAEPHVLAEFLCRAAEGRRLAEEDVVLEDAGVARSRTGDIRCVVRSARGRCRCRG